MKGARRRPKGLDGSRASASHAEDVRAVRPESIGDVRLKDIRVPTLVMHHGQDACRATPYADTVGLLRDLASTPRRELLTFEGGLPPQSGPCEPRAAHGFFGLDAEVVAAIVRWMIGGPRS